MRDLLPLPNALRLARRVVHRMYSRLVVPLLCAAAIVFACGPRSRGTTANSPAPAAGRLPHGAGPDRARRPAIAVRRRLRRGDTTSVDGALDLSSGQGGVRLELQVVNLTPKQLELDFPNGQTREFVVLDESGREVWRWSRGRLFTQTVQNRFLAAGDTAVYDARWAPRAPGRYTVVATLRSENHPLERRATFVVQSPHLAVASTLDAR